MFFLAVLFVMLSFTGVHQIFRRTSPPLSYRQVSILPGLVTGFLLVWHNLHLHVHTWDEVTLNVRARGSCVNVGLFPIELEFSSVDFCGGRKTGEPGEKPSERGREQPTNSTHIWHRVRESNPGHIWLFKAIFMVNCKACSSKWKVQFLFSSSIRKVN